MNPNFPWILIACFKIFLQGFLWFKAVQTANKEAEEQDRRDGFS
jgi:hypothetical protein